MAQSTLGIMPAMPYLTYFIGTVIPLNLTSKQSDDNISSKLITENLILTSDKANGFVFLISISDIYFNITI